MTADTHQDLLTRNVEDIIVRAELEKQLKRGQKLRIKYGVDVTAPTLHIGHAVNLWKMRGLQDRGHKVIFLIGDFTTKIGDPTGKSKTRPVIPQKEIEQNLKEFIEQAKMVLRFNDPNLLEIRRNSEWYGKMKTERFLDLLTMITHARLIERDMFQQRIKNHADIYMHELLYPILQGWDSVELQSDLTIIGNDQLFNEMLGRFYQEKMGQAPQTIITTSITPGLDGGEKQSKSLGNYVGLAHDPLEKYGRVMTLRDNLIIAYFKAYTDMPLAQITQIEKDLAAGDNPRDAKASLARHIVARYHGEATALEVERLWETQFRQGQLPQDIPELTVSKRRLPIVLDILSDHFKLSNSEARRLLSQNGVKVDGRAVNDASFSAYSEGSVVQVGKRRFVRIRLS